MDAIDDDSIEVVDGAVLSQVGGEDCSGWLYMSEKSTKLDSSSNESSMGKSKSLKSSNESSIL